MCDRIQIWVRPTMHDIVRLLNNSLFFLPHSSSFYSSFDSLTLPLLFFLFFLSVLNSSTPFFSSFSFNAPRSKRENNWANHFNPSPLPPSFQSEEKTGRGGGGKTRLSFFSSLPISLGLHPEKALHSCVDSTGRKKPLSASQNHDWNWEERRLAFSQFRPIWN